MNSNRNNLESAQSSDLILINPKKRQKLNQQIQQFNTDLFSLTSNTCSGDGGGTSNGDGKSANDQFKLIFNRENFDDVDMYDDDDDEDDDEDDDVDVNSTDTGKKMKLKKQSKKKTKGRVKIKMEFIENKIRRYTTFSKRKTGIMKKAYELSTLTGTQVMLLVASETGHVYTFATKKLQPMITSEDGRNLIQTCLRSNDDSGQQQHHSSTPTTTIQRQTPPPPPPSTTTIDPDHHHCTNTNENIDIETNSNNNQIMFDNTELNFSLSEKNGIVNSHNDDSNNSNQSLNSRLFTNGQTVKIVPITDNEYRQYSDEMQNKNSQINDTHIPLDQTTAILNAELYDQTKDGTSYITVPMLLQTNVAAAAAHHQLINNSNVNSVSISNSSGSSSGGGGSSGPSKSRIQKLLTLSSTTVAAAKATMKSLNSTDKYILTSIDQPASIPFTTEPLQNKNPIQQIIYSTQQQQKLTSLCNSTSATANSSHNT